LAQFEQGLVEARVEQLAVELAVKTANQTHLFALPQLV
jgi:hypothetical protein